MDHFIPIFMCVLSTLVLLKSLQKFAFNINLVDRPNHRKIHEGNVPLIGGIAIMGGFMVAALLSPRSPQPRGRRQLQIVLV